MEPEETPEPELTEEFNPLRTWDEVVRDLGEPNLGPLGTPEEDLAR